MSGKQGKYQRQKQRKTKKSSLITALDILKRIFTVLVAVAAVGMMIFTIISVTTFDRNDRSLFGYQAFIVRSDSMSATDFNAGDLVFTKQVDPKTLKEGDIISFRSTNVESFGEVVTHKIRALTTDADGNPGFITYGTTTNTDDTSVVTYEYVIGKYQGNLPYVGTFFSFLKTTPGYICCIFLPFMLLIVMQGINSVKLFQQYQREKNEEMQAERDQIAAEREEARRMMEELQKMRAKMGVTTSPAYSGNDGDINAALHTADRQQGLCLSDYQNQEEIQNEQN